MSWPKSRKSGDVSETLSGAPPDLLPDPASVIDVRFAASIRIGAPPAGYMYVVLDGEVEEEAAAAQRIRAARRTHPEGEG
jgi:hypothetical protein